MKKGIIFDMDGTLWDSSVQVAESWNRAVQRNGYPRAPLTVEDIQGVMGKTMDVIARLLFPEAGEEEARLLLEECCGEENDYLGTHGGVLYPEVRPTLERLKQRCPLYIVSNCQSGYIEAFLGYYEMEDLFEDFECYGNNGLQKGENIRLLWGRNGLDDAVYIGDTQSDHDASREAGAKFVHAAYGFGTICENVPEAERFCDLPKVLEEMGFLPDGS